MNLKIFGSNICKYKFNGWLVNQQDLINPQLSFKTILMLILLDKKGSVILSPYQYKKIHILFETFDINYKLLLLNGYFKICCT